MRALVVSVACLAAGCTGGDDSVERGSSITVLYPSDMGVFGPVWDDSPKFLLSAPLVSYERGSACGPPTPALAERWEYSDDFTEWTVWLREDVRWHDGHPFTADDVAFTIDVLTHPDVLSYNAGVLDSAVALNDRTVRFFASVPHRWPLEGWVTFLPKHLLEDEDPADFYEWSFWQNPIGNGPFRFARGVPQTMIELEANPDYYGGRPDIDRVIIKLSAVGSSGLMELQSGGVDVILTDLVEAQRIERDPRLQVAYRVSSSHTRWLLYNPRHPILSEPAVRRALTRGLDRVALQAGLGFPAGARVTDAPYSNCQFVSDELPPAWPHDSDEAARLLAAAGWADRDGDGVVERGGEPLRFETVLTEGDLPAALLVQAQFRSLGVDMEIRPLEAAVIEQRLRDGDFEAGIFPHVLPRMLFVGTPDAPDARSQIFRDAYPRIVELLESIAIQPDPEVIEARYAELATRFHEALPATFLHPKAYPLAATSRVEGLSWDDWSPPAWRWPFGGLEFLSLRATESR